MATSTDSQPLTKEAIQALLRTKIFGRTLHLLHTTTSTNSEAMTLAQQGAADGTLVVAEAQTAGKGRLGRRWYSPPGENLYCSVIIRNVPADDLSGWLSAIPLLSAVAVAKAVRAVAGLKPSLKWPNDILVGDRKLGGLLCESNLAGPSSTLAKTFVVVGVGLNVNSRRESFPEDIREIATSIVTETGRLCDRASLLATLLLELELYSEALTTRPPGTLLSEYARLCSTLGRRVRVNLAGGEAVEGLADSLAPDGALLVIRDQASGGGTVEVRAGDVVHLR